MLHGRSSAKNIPGLSREPSNNRFNDLQAIFSFGLPEIQWRQKAKDLRAGWYGEQSRCMQQIGKTHCLRLAGFARKVRNVRSQFEPNHQAKAARVLNNTQIFFAQCQQAVLEKIADAPRILAEILALNYLQDA